MKTLRIIVCALLCAVLVNSALGSSHTKYTTMAGYWQTLDDKTHLPSSVMYIWEHNKVYYAKVAKIYAIGKQNPKDVCRKCVGVNHNKPIVGMTIMHAMQAQGNGFYSGGKIFDPKSAKLYRCHMTLMSDGLRLKVRGYIGFSLFGRSQVWSRLESLNSKHPLVPSEK
tara:strand:+ start:252 stop:755 length:504 start_codon:yes stop_codon:yes gene_type:complete